MAVVARAGPGAVRLGPIHFHAGPTCGDFFNVFNVSFVCIIPCNLLVRVHFCCVRFSFFSIMLSEWPGKHL